MEYNYNHCCPKPRFQEYEVYGLLAKFVASPDVLMDHGYPIEILQHPGSVIMYKIAFESETKSDNTLNCYERFRMTKLTKHRNEDNLKLVYNSISDATIILPPTLTLKWQEIIIPDNYVCLEIICQFTEQDSMAMMFKFDEDITNYNNNDVEMSEQLKCVRCKRFFFVSRSGDYLTKENCFYHPEKLYLGKYNCCLGDNTSKGCSQNDVHVWNGTEPGFNPKKGFVKTQPRPLYLQVGDEKVYALDTEMCYTSGGLEATKISVVSMDGRIVYSYMIQPTTRIVDYNTRFSGVTAADFENVSQVKTLQEVHEDLLSFIFSDTILIGHGLENDLRALKIIHYKVIDTAILFPDPKGFPYRTSLKKLAKSYLNRIIQGSNDGHDCSEDARATMDLVLYKLELEPVSNREYTLPSFCLLNNVQPLWGQQEFYR